MRWVKAFLLILGLYAARGALAQSAAGDKTTTSSYLLRLERAEYLQSVCVLLNGNGRYHLERHSLRKVRVFEGTLGAEELRGLVHIASSDLLYNLEQKQIPDMMLKSDNDRVALEIHRPGEWQQLVFPDSASREPFRDAMDPLLKWLDAVNKRKAKELSEEAGRTNCLPPAKPEFARRKAAQPQAPAASVAAPVQAPAPATTYTLLLFDQRMVKYRTEAKCLLVSNSGTYHLVKQSRSYNKEMSNFVLDGTLSPSALTSLHSVLDAPELRNQPEEEQEHELIFTTDSYLTRLAIPRGASVQKLAAWKSYRIINNTLTSSVEDHGTTLLVPLWDWINANIHEESATPVTTPPNPRCLPEG